MRLHHALLAALAVAAAVPAQRIAWQIPHRGAHVFDRVTQRFRLSPPPSQFPARVAVHSGRSATPHEWRYITRDRKSVPGGFRLPDYDDSRWSVGKGGFGPTPEKTRNHNTVWNNDACCLRTRVDLGNTRPKALWFRIDHDDRIRVWLNGEQIVANNGNGKGREYFVTGTRHG